MIAGVEAGAGRVIVAADSDFVGDDSIGDLDHARLWQQLVTWTAAGPAAHRAAESPSAITAHPAWT
ncbi:MAG: hypothetical protein VW239_11405, partial [Candidatus Nanopelagicales bacterium]